MARRQPTEAFSPLPAGLSAEDRVFSQALGTGNQIFKSNIESTHLSIPAEFPYDFGSPVFTPSLASPGDSTETDESSDDEEDFLAGLTRRLALSTPRLVAPCFSLDRNEEKCQVIARPPQSTLYSLGCWPSSGNGSPNTPSPRMTSPTTIPSCCDVQTRDVIYAAAGQVAEMKLKLDTNISARNQVYKMQAPPYFTPDTRQSVGYRSKASYHHHQVVLHNRLKSEEAFERKSSPVWAHYVRDASLQDENQKQHFSHDHCNMQQRRPSGVVRSESGGVHVRPLNICKTTWSATAQRPVPRSMNPELSTRVSLPCRDVANRPSAGTGVFLPRRYVNSTEPRKKGVQVKVAQSPNPCFEERGDYLRSRPDPTSTLEYCDAIMRKRFALLALQRGPRSFPGVNSEVALARQWNC